mmetsp:Transcript_7669/g.12255  ORF Transcript_7669/g.12255 Transcript_7669/m.12255 type:complete len:341 (+) Transcript_7669:789-1811(+)
MSFRNNNDPNNRAPTLPTLALTPLPHTTAATFLLPSASAWTPPEKAAGFRFLPPHIHHPPRLQTGDPHPPPPLPPPSDMHPHPDLTTTGMSSLKDLRNTRVHRLLPDEITHLHAVTTLLLMNSKANTCHLAIPERPCPHTTITLPHPTPLTDHRPPPQAIHHPRKKTPPPATSIPTISLSMPQTGGSLHTMTIRPPCTTPLTIHPRAFLPPQATHDIREASKSLLLLAINIILLLLPPCLLLCVPPTSPAVAEIHSTDLLEAVDNPLQPPSHINTPSTVHRPQIHTSTVHPHCPPTPTPTPTSPEIIRTPSTLADFHCNMTTHMNLPGIPIGDMSSHRRL